MQTWPSSGDAAASDGTRLALADRSGAIFLYLLKTGVLEQTLRVPSSHAAVDRMAWVGGTLYSASSASGELRRWTLPAGTSKALISKANWMSGNQNFAPVRGQVVVSRRDSLEGVSLPEGQRLWKITAPNPFFLMVSAGGTRLAYKGLGGGWTLLELPGGKVLPPLEGLAALGRDREPNFGTFSPDGERLAMGVDKQVWLWDTRNGRLLARSSDLASEPGVLAFSPDGHRLAVGVGTPTEGAITELSVP